MTANNPWFDLPGDCAWMVDTQPPPLARGSLFSPASAVGQTSRAATSPLASEAFTTMVAMHRLYGHELADIDPMGRRARHIEEISPPQDPSLQAVFDKLQRTYCGYVGVELMHLRQALARDFLLTRIERSENRRDFSLAEKKKILTGLTYAESFETFLQRKFVGAKRFSLEGCESFLPMIQHLVAQASHQAHVAKVVIGMAHRGRLNVLANLLGKDAALIYRDFLDADPTYDKGDVKYHMGYEGDYQGTAVSMCYNPSHLEFVNPVVAGRVRALRDQLGQPVLGIMVHGDAAMMGQGVVAETFNLSQLRGYHNGGTIHVVINNQIGFTTSPSDARSSMYASDVAKILDIPILHVNAEQPEAAIWAIELALQYWQQFGRDVVVDLVGYRKHGHNEGDEPNFTQPVMYQWIGKRPTVRQLYVEAQTAEHQRELAAEALLAAANANWDAALQKAQSPQATSKAVTPPSPPRHRSFTSLDAAMVQSIGQRLQTLPADFAVHSKVQKLYQSRLEMCMGQRPLDWGGAEALAYAYLLQQGIAIRLSGQDAGRGTFSHRHAVLKHLQDESQSFIPLQQFGKFSVWDSPLSETAVMGFDYGYSLESPQDCTIWEAQFGDFANGAQVIIDQFLTSGAQKWHTSSNLVLLLPHGFEGQGPEHSSARLERFLQAAANDNLCIAQPTTPAQIFKLLVRHMAHHCSTPLVVLTPKSLLRHPQAISSRDELLQGEFAPVLAHLAADNAAEKVILCSGKVYYDLLAAMPSTSHTMVLRLEQLYPFPQAELATYLPAGKRQRRLVWLQDEPENMGAWPTMASQWQSFFNGRGQLQCVARPLSSSPATGSASHHKYQQEQLIKRALA